MATHSLNRLFVWIIVILLFIGLLGFGTGGFSSRLTKLGSVGDQEITIQDYQSGVDRQMQLFRQQFGPEVTIEQARSIGLDQAVISELITLALFDQAASDLGLSVGDQSVYEQVTQIPAFQNLNGQFEAEAYKASLNRAGLTEASFEQDIRRDLARGLLQSALISGLKTPDIYAQVISDYTNERRSVTWAAIDESHLTEPLGTPTQAELEQFYTDNPELFTTAELRKISYAWVTPDMLAQSIDIETSLVKGLYDERHSDFNQPERRLVERLIFDSLEAAQNALENIDNGDTTFDTVVSERGLALSDIDLGDVTQDDLAQAAEPVFTAKTGDIAGPVDTDIGPALFRINAILAAKTTDFSEVQEQLTEELKIARAGREIDQMQEQINDFIAGGATLDDLTERTGLTKGSVGFTEDNRDGIAAYDAFRSAALSAKEGEYPSIIELSDGGIALLRLDSITAPQVQKASDIQDEIATAYAKQQTSVAISNKADRLLKALDNGETFASLELNAITETALTRRSFVEGTALGFIERLFDTPPSDTFRLAANDGKVIIAQVDAISGLLVDDPQASNIRELIQRSTDISLGQDLLDIIRQDLSSNTDITIDEALINNLQFN